MSDRVSCVYTFADKLRFVGGDLVDDDARERLRFVGVVLVTFSFVFEVGL